MSEVCAHLCGCRSLALQLYMGSVLTRWPGQPHSNNKPDEMAEPAVMQRLRWRPSEHGPSSLASTCALRENFWVKLNNPQSSPETAERQAEYLSLSVSDYNVSMSCGFSLDSLLHVWRQEQLCIDSLRNYLKNTCAHNWKKPFLLCFNSSASICEEKQTHTNNKLL